MARASDPLLAWLRKTIDEKGLNTAKVAEVSGLTRARLRKVLTGGDPMWVDELLAITKALELTPAELAAAGDLPDAAPTLRIATGDEVPQPVVDPWGNQPEQLVRIAFTLGCDFFCLIDGRQLEGSKLPVAVINQYRGRDLPVKLDAAYHKYNNPRYDATGLTLALSFDAVYDCRFSWSSIKQVIFFPIAPEPNDEPEEKAPGPMLRLVT